MSISVSKQSTLMRILFFLTIISITVAILCGDKASASGNHEEDDSKIIEHVQTKYIKSDSIVLREGPDSKSNKVKILNKNATFKVTNKKKVKGSTWMLGKADNKTGWIQLEHLSDKKNDAHKLVEYGSKYIGIPYLWGGTNNIGFDCSGFTQYIYKSINKKIPRTAEQQYKSASKISKNKAKPGDLVFFSGDGKKVTHVAIYVGDGKILHASSSKGVNIGKINDGYWNKRLIGFGTLS